MTVPYTGYGIMILHCHWWEFWSNDTDVFKAIDPPPIQRKKFNYGTWTRSWDPT